MLTLRLQEGETGLVIDESQDVVLVGLVGPAPPRGFGVRRVLLFNVESRSVEDVAIGQFIPSARQEAGGGIQVLVMP